MATELVSDCEPFEPDHDLVVGLANYLGSLPKGSAFMVMAYGVLIHLYDQGVELPEAHPSDGGQADG